MAAQILDYTKISELNEVNQVANDDVIVINHNGVTSKMKYSTLKNLLINEISVDITALTQRVATLESSVSAIGTTQAEHTQTINNIITAGFNLIGVDTQS